MPHVEVMVVKYAVSVPLSIFIVSILIAAQHANLTAAHLPHRLRILRRMICIMVSLVCIFKLLQRLIRRIGRTPSLDTAQREEQSAPLTSQSGSLLYPPLHESLKANIALHETRRLRERHSTSSGLFPAASIELSAPSIPFSIPSPLPASDSLLARPVDPRHAWMNCV